MARSSDPLSVAKANLFTEAASLGAFAKNQKLELDYTVETFEEFQEIVIRYYSFLKRNTHDDARNIAVLKRKIGSYLTVMICNDLQETGAHLFLPAARNDKLLHISVLPAVSINAYQFASDAIDNEFVDSGKIISIRFEKLMDFLSDIIDRIEATDDKDLNPITKMF